MSRIHDNKTKPYGKITISKYKTEFIILVLKKLLLNNDFETSLYFFTELHASGKFDDMWFVIFDVMLEHIHILNYKLPYFLYQKYKKYELLHKNLKGNKLEIRNIGEIRKDLFHIIRILTFSPKENITKYIPKSYYSIKEDAYDSLGNVFTEQYNPNLSILKEVTNAPNSKNINYAIQNFKQSLIKILKHNSLFDRMQEKETIFFWLSRIITNSLNNSNIIGFPNSINLYDSYDKDDYDQYIMNLWNIILLSSKSDKFLFNQIGSLYQMYTICSKNKKCDYTFLNRFIIISILYITDKPNKENPILERLFKNNMDHRPIHTFYANIQESIVNDTQRIDYIQLKKKSDIAKEEQKIKQKKQQKQQKQQKQSNKKSRKKNSVEIKKSDSRLEINQNIEKKQSKFLEEKKEKLNYLIDNHRYNTNDFESIPMIQNNDEREKDILIVEQEQNEIDKIHKLKHSQKIEQEIQEELYTNYELETNRSEMNSSNSNKTKNEFSFINDEVLPDIFRLITFYGDIIENDIENDIENNIENDIKNDIKNDIEDNNTQNSNNYVDKKIVPHIKNNSISHHISSITKI